MIDTTALVLAAQVHSRCACSDATRVYLAGHEIPVGSTTVIFAVTALLFAGPVIAGRIARIREARAMRRVLDGR